MTFWDFANAHPMAATIVAIWFGVVILGSAQAAFALRGATRKGAGE